MISREEARKVFSLTDYALTVWHGGRNIRYRFITALWAKLVRHAGNNVALPQQTFL